MTFEEFDQQFDARIAVLRSIRDTKGAKYTEGAPDRLANFKNVAASVGVTPLQVWQVYFEKHWSSVKHYLQTGKDTGSEVVENHLNDCIMYLHLLEGLITELKRPETKCKTCDDTGYNHVNNRGTMIKQFCSCEAGMIRSMQNSVGGKV